MKIQLFVPCFVDQLYPQVAINMVTILEKFGCEVSYNTEQTCCGQPAYNAGFMKEAKDVSKKFINDFSGTEYIVSPSGSCTGYIRGCFAELFDHSTYHNEAIAVAARSVEFTEFLVNILKVEDVGATYNAVATYHDACGALRECGIKNTPRTLLKNVNGLILHEMKECETCCGFGGTFAVKYEPISIGMAATKVNSAIEAGADTIISTDISCLMHLEGYIKKQNLNINTLHIADVLVNF